MEEEKKEVEEVKGKGEGEALGSGWQLSCFLFEVVARKKKKTMEEGT